MKKFMAMAVLVVAVAAVAVWKFSGETNPDNSDLETALAEHSDHLALIPEDTLFYVGGLKPIAAKDMMASMASMYQFGDPEMWQQMNQQMADDLAGSAETAGAKLALSLFRFFMQGLDDPQAMFAKTGAKENLFTSIYSVGWIPVVRFEADQVRFEAFLDQLEADAQVAALNKAVNGINYRAYPLAGDANKGLDLVAGYYEGDAIFTLGINGLPDQQALAMALGVEKPAKSLKQAGTVVKLKDEYGYLPDSLAYISFQQVIRALTSANNLAGDMLSELDADAQNKLAVIRSPECAAEFNDIAALWPRWVMGYRTLTYGPQGFAGDFHMNIEIKQAALTEVLKQLSGHLPKDLRSDQADIFSLAIGLDVSRLDSIIGGIAKLAEGLQYRCELLQDLNRLSDSINAVRPMVAMSTGMARGLKGLRATVYDVQGDLAAGEVTSADALISLSGDQVRALLNILMAMNPDVGMVAIPEDGSPVALPLPQDILQAVSKPVEVMLAATDKHALIFSGERAKAVQANALKETINEDGFLFFSLDYGKYMSLLGGIMEVAAQKPDITADEKAEIEAFRSSMMNMNYREEILMRFTDKGIEFDGKIDIKNP